MVFSKKKKKNPIPLLSPIHSVPLNTYEHFFLVPHLFLQKLCQCEKIEIVFLQKKMWTILKLARCLSNDNEESICVLCRDCIVFHCMEMQNSLNQPSAERCLKVLKTRFILTHEAPCQSPGTDTYTFRLDRSVTAYRWNRVSQATRIGRQTGLALMCSSLPLTQKASPHVEEKENFFTE